MKNMLYVTNLISEIDSEEVHIYLSLQDFKKHAFTPKNGVLIPRNDKELLDVLNHVNKVVYDQKIETENNNILDKSKKTRTTKEKFQRILASLGVIITLFTFEPQLAEGVSYILKRTGSISHSSVINVNTPDEAFIDQFNISIGKNDAFTEQEREAISKGFQNYINDWGYLLEEVDREYILSLAQSVNVNRGVWLPPWASADYFFKTINLKYDQADLESLTHEIAHAFSDRGLLIGSINGYGFGYALNEGINTSVNCKYYSDNDYSYSEQKHEVLKLSLLVNDEVIMKTYMKEGPEYLIKSISNHIKDVSYSDVLKYLSMMDLELFIDGYQVLKGYKLPEQFYETKDALYNKMFKAKYGYDYSESILGTSKQSESCNFLDKKVFLEREEGIYYRYYELEKSVLALNASSVNISEKMIDEFELISDDYKNQLLVQEPEQTAIYFGSWEAFSNYVIGRNATDEEVNQIKNIFEVGVDEDNYQLYVECVVKKALSYDLPADFVACYLRGANSVYYEHFYKDFDLALIAELEKYGRDDVIDLYCNTTISFSYFDFDNPSYYASDFYYNLRKKEDYIITDDNKLVLKFNDDEVDFGNLIYDGILMNTYDWELSSDVVYNELFGCENEMFFIFDFSKVGIDKVDRDFIDLKMCTEPKIHYNNSISMQSSK